MSLLLLFNQTGGGGATAYTLACTNGAYPWSGVEATLGFNRKLPAVTGNYAYTGRAATFAFGRKLSAAVGNYAYVGKVATLTLTLGAQHLTLVCAVGNYAYTGGAATFTFGRKLPALSGSYAYTGRAASFALSRKLAAASGNYAYSGKAATFTHVHIVWPDPSQVLLGVQYGPTGTDYTGAAVGGSGETVFASMFSVSVEQPTVTVTHRAKRQAPEMVAPVRPVEPERATKNKAVSIFTATERITVLTAQDEITVTSSTQSVSTVTRLSSAIVTRNRRK